MTEYVILDFPTGDGWRVLTERKARSAKAAIQDVLVEHPLEPEEEEAYFVAIPKRSWRPVTVKTETKTQLKFS